MKKDLLSTALDEERRSQRLLHGRQYRRGERERENWLNRDATRGGSFFEGRKTMREALQSEEKRNIYDGGGDAYPWKSSTTGRGGGKGDGANKSSNDYPTSLLSGQFQRSIRSFLNGGGDCMTSPTTQRRRQDRGGRFSSSPPPWEVGPDGLRLPRKLTVMRESSSSLEDRRASLSNRGGLNEVNIASDMMVDAQNDDDEEEGVVTLDSCVATGSV
jgi:hypothetical protein